MIFLVKVVVEFLRDTTVTANLRCLRLHHRPPPISAASASISYSKSTHQEAKTASVYITLRIKNSISYKISNCNPTPTIGVS
ncbi:hypothetical protein L1887_44299 [Cichorium endivia]|nr:hypothetical protein L1887_44299 [Cichorium endivia]